MKSTAKSVAISRVQLVLKADLSCAKQTDANPQAAYACSMQMSDLKLQSAFDNAYMNCAGAMFLLWELSTPFVYARWFLHKAGMSRTTAYKINGVLMVLVFFLCRNVAGLGEN